MMEIKFKGQNGYTRKWIYGYFVNHDNYPQIWVLDKTGAASYPQVVDFETVSQYSGHDDINGNEIYLSSDIVRVTVEDDLGLSDAIMEGIIYFSKRRWKICIKGHEDFILSFADSIEIIGNIHDIKES